MTISKAERNTLTTEDKKNLPTFFDDFAFVFVFFFDNKVIESDLLTSDTVNYY